MENELIVLGTGHGMATKCYNTCFAIRTGQQYFLVDAGGGNSILDRLDKEGINFNNTRHMFVTHGHTDHILGAIWVIRSYCEEMLEGRFAETFTVYAHKDLISMLRTFFKMLFAPYLQQFIDNGIIIREVQDGETIRVNGMLITFFDIASTKLKQFGFQAILPSGKILTCLGDEPYKVSSEKYSKNADWLLAEAFCLYSEREKFHPYEKHHSTALDAGRQAEELNVKNLILYHTEDSDLEHRKARYSEEASYAFSRNTYVPDDLERFNLD
jgi:ribonuclease Z